MEYFGFIDVLPTVGEVWKGGGELLIQTVSVYRFIKIYMAPYFYSKIIADINAIFLKKLTEVSLVDTVSNKKHI